MQHEVLLKPALNIIQSINSMQDCESSNYMHLERRLKTNHYFFLKEKLKKLQEKSLNNVESRKRPSYYMRKKKSFDAS